jgi:hypothetical protein
MLLIGVDLFPLQASTLCTDFIHLSICFVKIIFQLSVFMKAIVMSFPCFMKIFLAMNTIFVMKFLLWRKIFLCPGIEVLDYIQHDGCITETSGIISDVFFLLYVNEYQHVSFENYGVYEQMFFAVDVSPGHGIEAKVVYYSYEEDAEDIPVLEVDGFGIPAHGEVVMLSIDLEKPTFREYPNKEDDEHNFSMFLVYYDCEFDSWECHEKEKEELKVNFISSSEPRYEKTTTDPCDDDEILIPGLELDGLPMFCDEYVEVFSEGKCLIFQPFREREIFFQEKHSRDIEPSIYI